MFFQKTLPAIKGPLGAIVAVTRTRFDLIENCLLHRKTTLQLFAVMISCMLT